MKKILLTTMALLALGCAQVAAQGIVIQNADGSLTTVPVNDGSEMTLATEDQTFVFGTWYLSYYKAANGTVTRYDGRESITFGGSKLSYVNASGPTLYSLRFYGTTGSNPYFRSTRRSGSGPSSILWYINKHNDDKLVLKDGDAIRCFYRDKEEAAGALVDPDHNESTNINVILKYASGKSNSTKTPMGTHFENRHATTDADRQWLSNPANEPHLIANLKKWVAKPVNLYPYGDPTPADVNQHAIGDCCACAVWASMAYLYPGFIKSIITDNGNQTYTVKMYDPQGQPVDVCVSNKMLCDSNGNIGQVTSKNNVVAWSTILEKAMIKWQYIYKVNEGVEGIGTEHAAPLFTGCGNSFAFSPNSLYTSELKQAIEYCLGKGYICVGGFNVGDLLCGTLTTVTGHAFTYMLSGDENYIFNMRNPWGNGSNQVDGQLQIPNDRRIVQTIDARIVEPGAAAPFLREDIGPYDIPSYVKKQTDLGVSPRLMQRHRDNPNSAELW